MLKKRRCCYLPQYLRFFAGDVAPGIYQDLLCDFKSPLTKALDLSYCSTCSEAFLDPVGPKFFQKSEAISLFCTQKQLSIGSHENHPLRTYYITVVWSIKMLDRDQSKKLDGYYYTCMVVVGNVRF